MPADWRITPNFVIPHDYSRKFVFAAGGQSMTISTDKGDVVTTTTDTRYRSLIPKQTMSLCLDFIQESIEMIRQECEALHG